MQIGSTMNALQTGELLEALFRHISEEANSFSDELADPDKGWQVELMTDRFTVSCLIRYQSLSALNPFTGSATARRCPQIWLSVVLPCSRVLPVLRARPLMLSSTTLSPIST